MRSPALDMQGSRRWSSSVPTTARRRPGYGQDLVAGEGQQHVGRDSRKRPGRILKPTVSCTSRWAAENPRKCWVARADFGEGFLYPGAEVARAAAVTATPSASTASPTRLATPAGPPPAGRRANIGLTVPVTASARPTRARTAPI